MMQQEKNKYELNTRGNTPNRHRRNHDLGCMAAIDNMQGEIKDDVYRMQISTKTRELTTMCFLS